MASSCFVESYPPPLLSDLATYGTSEVMPPPNPVEAEGEAIALLEQQQQHQQQLLHGTDHGIADQ
eukprot:284158-Pelagomonas_calceolata.AAC.1